MRWQIHPGLIWAWRAPGRVQIGLDPSLGVILDGLTEVDERLLDALTGDGADSRRLRSLGVRLGAGEPRVRELVDTLRLAGVLVPRHTSRSRLRSLPDDAVDLLRPQASSLALTYAGGDGWDVLLARRNRSVVVSGGSPTGVALAIGLARAGVGQVQLSDDARVRPTDVHPGGFTSHDVGRRREVAGSEVLRRAVPTLRPTPRPGATPDLVVAVRSGVIDASRYDVLVRDDVPHLAVLLRERDVVVGPLVLPGVSACLRCVDLHRRDRDPEWPRVVPQVADRSPDAEDPVLSALAAAVAVAQGLTQLDGLVDPAAVGATLEIALPHGTTAVRDWPVHPACGCRTLPGRTPGPVGPPGGAAAGRAATLVRREQSEES